MGRILTIQPQPCRCKAGGRCNHEPITISWSGHDACQIRKMAKDVGQEPQDYVRWAVEKTTAEGTFNPVKYWKLPEEVDHEH